MYNEAEEFLKDAAEILAKLRDYKGATKEIRYVLICTQVGWQRTRTVLALYLWIH